MKWIEVGLVGLIGVGSKQELPSGAARKNWRRLTGAIYDDGEYTIC